MASKKSNPDARAGKVVSIGQALNGKGPKIDEGGKASFIFNDLNKGGGKKSDPFAFSGTHAPKTEINIPSVKTMKSNLDKQESENDAINKKRRGGY